MTLILWSHALAALLFAGMAVTRLRDAGSALPRLTFVVALGVTALWALAVAGIDARDVTTGVVESLRNLAWLGFMFALIRRDQASPERRAVAIIYGVVAVVITIGIGLTIADALVGRGSVIALATALLVLRMMVAVGALLLVHHLYVTVAPRARGGIRLVVIALAAMWSIDLLLYGARYLINGDANALLAARGVVMALTAPLFAVAVQRNGDWTLQVSRTVAWQTLSLAATLLYAGAMLVATSTISRIGGDNARLFQAAFVVGSTTALLTILSSPWIRAWAKVKLAKHFFRHRYDYRAEWVRFTETLGKPDDAAPLDQRIVKAVADLTDSPAGLLLVPDGPGLGIGAGWNWDRGALPASGADEALARYMASGGRIIELDAVRNESAEPADLASVPQWILDTDAWALVPLAHLGRLQGVIMLARPPIDRALDWEDLDLLRIAGRQVASYLAEARAQEALADAQRFEEFNRRFAFIMHDIKNLVSQLTLVARNAERHADNPAFRADMIATLQDSVGRMNDLLARLSQHHGGRSEALRAVELMPLAERVAARRRAQHPIAVIGDRAALALADPVRLEQLLGHLVQNAAEASAPSDPVTIAITGGADRATIEVIDQGCGMSPAFLRDQLFKPFVSTKANGFGIGAFEARQLAEAMGGGVSVVSREGEGTRFRVTLGTANSHILSLGEAA
ncbi:MAG: XrtA/PEP-CTERM system histidine kinase PrsK [Sphingomonas sp.]|jgi:putative PEP-CTERM system histidine kinase|uniref:XrtA/PEP-CTERM system histidine kinase PrsK n=1 Tax=Sphingomonas sp. TaxID=28214 RepID=UPI00356642E0